MKVEEKEPGRQRDSRRKTISRPVPRSVARPAPPPLGRTTLYRCPVAPCQFTFSREDTKNRRAAKHLSNTHKVTGPQMKSAPQGTFKFSKISLTKESSSDNHRSEGQGQDGRPEGQDMRPVGQGCGTSSCRMRRSRIPVRSSRLSSSRLYPVSLDGKSLLRISIDTLLAEIDGLQNMVRFCSPNNNLTTILALSGEGADRAEQAAHGRGDGPVGPAPVRPQSHRGAAGRAGGPAGDGQRGTQTASRKYVSHQPGRTDNLVRLHLNNGQ